MRSPRRSCRALAATTAFVMASLAATGVAYGGTGSHHRELFRTATPIQHLVVIIG